MSKGCTPNCVGRTESRTASLIVLKSTSDNQMIMLVPRIFFVNMLSILMECIKGRNISGRVPTRTPKNSETGSTAIMKGVGCWIVNSSVKIIFDDSKA